MLADSRVQTTLPAADVDSLRAFYEGVLGFTPVAIRPAAAFYRSGDGWFVISRSGGKPSGAHTQMSFVVADLAAEVADLRRRGVTFEEYEARRRRPTASPGCLRAPRPGSRIPPATSWA